MYIKGTLFFYYFSSIKGTLFFGGREAKETWDGIEDPPSKGARRKFSRGAKRQNINDGWMIGSIF